MEARSSCAVPIWPRANAKRRNSPPVTTWQLGQAGIEAGPARALPPPDLPVMPPYAPMRGQLAAAHIRKAFMLFMGAALVMSAATHVVVEHPVASLIPLATPLAYLIAVAPMWLRREQA